jgi:hypothetical protein
VLAELSQTLGNAGARSGNQLKRLTMNTKWICAFSLSLCTWLAAATCCLAAVPAGTAIIVQTNAAISTHATPGNHFTATLAQDLGGVRAGAQCRGTIQASRGSRSTTSSSPLTLVLTSISANGHIVKIKTKSMLPQGAHTTSTRRGSFSFGEDVFPVGTRLVFHLSQPANL